MVSASSGAQGAKPSGVPPPAGVAILDKPKEEKLPKKAKQSDMIFVKELRTRLDSYFRIVVRNTRDSIPKVIGHFLVHAVQNKMQIELFKRLNKMFEAVNKAMGEPQSVIQERKALVAQQEVLRKAERTLTRDPEITNLISTTDDDLLSELKREKADEKAGKKVDQKKVIEECLQAVIPKNKLNQQVAEKPKAIDENSIPPRPSQMPAAAPVLAPAAAPKPEVKKSAKTSLFG